MCKEYKYKSSRVFALTDRKTYIVKIYFTIMPNVVSRYQPTSRNKCITQES